MITALILILVMRCADRSMIDTLVNEHEFQCNKTDVSKSGEIENNKKVKENYIKYVLINYHLFCPLKYIFLESP